MCLFALIRSYQPAFRILDFSYYLQGNTVNAFLKQGNFPPMIPGPLGLRLFSVVNYLFGRFVRQVAHVNPLGKMGAAMESVGNRHCVGCGLQEFDGNKIRAFLILRLTPSGPEHPAVPSIPPSRPASRAAGISGIPLNLNEGVRAFRLCLPDRGMFNTLETHCAF
jgi:hypothetical protein